jgi:hypothetical protein
MTHLICYPMFLERANDKFRMVNIVFDKHNEDGFTGHESLLVLDAAILP